MRLTLAGFALLLLGGCAPAPYLVPVGGTLGGGSSLLGPSGCTYEASPSVAQLSENRQAGVLIGEGSITSTCGLQTTRMDVVRPTHLVIYGPDEVHVGRPSLENFSVEAKSGDQFLFGSISPQWSLAYDCPGVAEFGPVYGSQDTGGPSTLRTLVGLKPGKCTITAAALGLYVSRTIEVR